MLRLFIIGIILFLFQSDQPFSQTHYTLEDAEEAYLGFELEKSREILTELLNVPSLTNKKRCKALRMLALQDWKFYANKEQALNYLTKALNTRVEMPETWILLSRIQRESGNLLDALKAAENACIEAQLKHERIAAHIEYGHTIYDLSIRQLESGESLSKELLTKASQRLAESLEEDPANIQVANRLLGISLLQKSGQMALRAWKCYFHINQMEEVNHYLEPYAQTLEQKLPAWNFHARDTATLKQVVKALAGSRFYEYASMLATMHSKTQQVQFIPDDDVKDIIFYSKYLKKLETETNAYYRKITLTSDRETEEAKYRRFLEEHRKFLWNNLSFIDPGVDLFTEDNFLDMTRQRFGARGFAGSTGNFDGFALALGHVVNQQTKTVEQYKLKARLTFTQLDQMISNGYSSWYWEDRQIGGWASSSEIVQIRSAYLSGPVKAWRLVTDSAEIVKNQKQMSEYLSSEDETLFKRGISLQLQTNVLKDLYVQLGNRGLTGKDLYFSFINTYKYYVQESSIFAHEGRHSIDAAHYSSEYRNWSSEEREFCAKLSEIVFAPEPRLTLSRMFLSMGNSGHQFANDRLLKILEDYIIANSNEIHGFDPGKPMLMQALLLSNDQIRSCFKNVDPINNKTIKKQRVL
jgi:hypothetical protein